MTTTTATYIQNLNDILDRKTTETQIKQFLHDFDNLKNDMSFKKGIYLYGSPGSGKTEFIMKILREMNYDAIKYDAGDIRNKNLIDSITSNNLSRCNVLEMMKRSKKKIAIVMDEIDGMNGGDKGGITALIKLIRQKKTKKQKLENKTLNPIICIGNFAFDKKIKELMKVCNSYELMTPTNDQVDCIINTYMPNIVHSLIPDIVKYIQGDLRKLEFIWNLYVKKPEHLNANTLNNIFQCKMNNDDSKTITKTLINREVHIKEHNSFMNETDRTIVALLWHENIIDMISNVDKSLAFSFYFKILQNMCFADYTDRITFQNQIWQFNEMSSLIKTFHNNKLFHATFPEFIEKYKPDEVRFTKVLTKYSTEYNNLLFIFELCQELDMDKKDLITFFHEIRLYFGNECMNDPDILNKLVHLFESTNISKLDIKRIYRYLDKNVKRDVGIVEDDPGMSSDDDL